jgi:hypothetical protein
MVRRLPPGQDALLDAAQLDPARASRRAELKAPMGHDFRPGLPMRDIIAAADESAGA